MDILLDAESELWGKYIDNEFCQIMATLDKEVIDERLQRYATVCETSDIQSSTADNIDTNSSKIGSS